MTAYPPVAGDAQEGETGIKRNSASNRRESGVPVGKVTGIFPQEVPDERFCQPFVICVLDEEMLKFAYHPAEVEDPVRQLHPFKIDNDHPKAVAEKDVGWRDITVNDDLPILPHAALANPIFLELPKLPDFIRSGAPRIMQVFENMVEICAILGKVHGVLMYRPIVQSRKKIGQARPVFQTTRRGHRYGSR